jgi:hypothetical protein
MLAVNGKAARELGRKSANAFPFLFQGASQNITDRVEQACPFHGVELCETRVRGETRPVEDVVRVPAPDSRHSSLIAQECMNAASVIALQHNVVELGRERLGTEASQGSVVTGPQNPPSGFPLGSEFLYQYGRAPLEEKSDYSVFWPRRFRRILEVDASALGQMNDYSGPIEVEHEVLSPGADTDQGATAQGFRRGLNGLERRELQRNGAGERATPQSRVKTLRQCMDLGKLRHPPTVNELPDGSGG